jgi:uncharacterized protein (TIGR02145 family)
MDCSMNRTLFLLTLLALSASMATLSSCDSEGSTSSISSSEDPATTLAASVTWGGQTYKTIRIGTQTWMAENLNYEVDSSWVHGGDVDSGIDYGRLYTWAAMMKLPDSCNTRPCASQVQSKHQGICPAGWHVPSEADWMVLATYAGGASTAGAKLKSTSGWSEDGVPGNGIDAYGFRALPAGGRQRSGEFGFLGRYTFFWSSAEDGAGNALHVYMYSGYDLLNGYPALKRNGSSVRCLLD